MWGGLSTSTSSAYPVSSGTILACRGRTPLGRSSSASTASQMTPLVVITSLPAGGPKDSGVRPVASSVPTSCRSDPQGVLQLPAPGFGHSGNRPPQNPNAHPSVVLGSLSNEHRNAWHIGSSAAAPAWTQALRDSLVHAPQTAASHGRPSAVPAHRPDPPSPPIPSLLRPL